MKNFKILLVSLFCFILGGCASIAGSNTRQVHINSTPPGAAIYVDNQKYGVTPGVVTLPSYIYGGKIVTLRKQGYQDTTAVVNTTFQPVALLDILFWPTFFVDALTGNLVKIDPASLTINADMQKLS